MAANVMLINLLVALFATTYEQVQEDSDKIWKLNRFDLVMDYWGKDPIPTPLILVYHVLLLIKYIRFSFGEKKSRRTTIVCWPRIPGDHAVNLRQFPLKVYPPTGKDSDAKNSINSLKHNTIDSLINNLIDFEKVEVATAKEKEDENEEPKEVMRQMNEKLERLRASVLKLQTRLRKKNKDE
ncbi:Oidioi.mRNA.OKI2018_I69.chr2.g7885.t1.cds [Oikopleura dioica]|uniref:Oidioi.mRNA.OKI2018_I69.chr2.g7885.t1.cds n=1 Tax=Oikopleura dioica TaxID=34765 RepID=A0ABN7TE18_OIKDI|nr:Oidioi.mRNA.OKI2018_I69.chr2.g7885.t1.cds [Oikopleura dioica]